MNEDQSIQGEEAIDDSQQSAENNQNISEENIEQPQTSNIELQTENMEVHKHAHHVTHKKKWGEYLLEFFMLFLAVFLGFVAENIRENIVEKEKGKQYIESFYEDLKTDTAKLNYLINFETKKIASLNQLQSCYDSILKKEMPVSLLVIIRNSLSNNKFLMNGRTLRQLTNAGGFRLLHKADADSIIHYEARGNNIEEYQSSVYQQSQDNLRNTFNEVADFIPYTKLYSDVVNKPQPDAMEIKAPLLLITDIVLLNKYFNQLFQYLRVIVGHCIVMDSFRRQATSLLEYFKNKYHFE